MIVRFRFLLLYSSAGGDHSNNKNNDRSRRQETETAPVQSLRRPFWNGSTRTTSEETGSIDISGINNGQNEETRKNSTTVTTTDTNIKSSGRWYRWGSLSTIDNTVDSISTRYAVRSTSRKTYTFMGNTPCVDATVEEEMKPNALVTLTTTTTTASNSNSSSSNIVVESEEFSSGDSESTTPNHGSASPVTVTVTVGPSSSQRSTGPIHFVMSIASKIQEAFDRLLFVDATARVDEPVISRERRIPGGVMLEGCQTKEEHFKRHDSIMEAIQQLKGEQGLRAANFEMRCVPCDDHAAQMGSSVAPATATATAAVAPCCERCMTRLFCNDTLVDATNRRRFVSDGKMYDEISRLCMEHAQHIMIAEADLEWKFIDSEIQALVSKTIDWSRPTLLFVTGKGKVRAGIFSRQHILTTGMEPSTAISFVREAKRRDMNIVMLDPNCRGEREAYSVVERSMSHVFSHLKQDCNGDNDSDFQHGPLFFQVHSASGAHVVCSLMDNCDCYLPHIRAIAFTDSTHNIQWTRKEKHRALYTLLESSSAVYVRSSKGDTTHAAGVEMSQCDAEWVRRFGRIRTVWAGTSEHSLSDWCARDFIWSHFDMHLTSILPPKTTE